MMAARPLSHASIYDPYSYYYHFDPNDRPECPPAPRTRPTRSGSLWSTSSICSDDSTYDINVEDFEDEDDDDFQFDARRNSAASALVASPVDIDDEDDEDDDLLRSPLSPTESASSRTSWSSSSSRTSRQSSYGRCSPAPTTVSSRTSSDKPRPKGPRPLPTLPTSQPCSPTSPTPTSLALPIVVPLKVTPPLRLNTKVSPPPPSYEEAISAAPVPAPQLPQPFLFDAEMELDDDASTQYLTSPLEDAIDWDSIEDYLVRTDG